MNILVVGASVAGPTAAYWLAKTGATVTVIERFPQLRTGGQNIDIRTVGVEVMRRTPGMEDAVRAKVLALEGGFGMVREDGTVFATMKPTGDPDQQSLVSEYEIFRSDLAGILVGLSREVGGGRVRYVFGEWIVGMTREEKGEEGVVVEFANGLLPTTRYDLVVGCDGATSRTRAMAFGCGVRDHIRSINTWAAYFSIKGDLLEGAKMGKSLSAVGGRWYAMVADPAGVTRVVMMGVKPQSDTDATLPFRTAMKDGHDALKRYICRYFEGMGWKTNQILQGAMDADDLYATEIVQVKIPTLHKDRVVFVGDAGYAGGPTGSGTSLAMCGAYILAGEIGRYPGDLDAGLAAYEERMRPIIDDLSQIPPGVMSFLGPQTAWGLWLRNLLFIVVTWGMQYSWLIGYTGLGWFASSFGSSKHVLPDYEWVA